MNLNKWLLSSIKAQAEQMDFIDPKSLAYAALCHFFDQCSISDLQTIAGQNIRWISALARNRIAARVEEECPLYE